MPHGVQDIRELLARRLRDVEQQPLPAGKGAVSAAGAFEILLAHEVTQLAR